MVDRKSGLGMIGWGWGKGVGGDVEMGMDGKKGMKMMKEGLIEIIEYGKMNDVGLLCRWGVGLEGFVRVEFWKGGRRGGVIYVEKRLVERVKYKGER